MMDQFANESDTALSGFTGAVSNQTSGIATLAIKVAAARINKAAKAKQQAMAAQLSKSINKLA